MVFIAPQTYRARLQGSQITWLDTPPELAPETEIYVTVPTVAAPDTARGEAMAAALAKLAQINPFENVDPVAWQQEARQDRGLPGRG